MSYKWRFAHSYLKITDLLSISTCLLNVFDFDSDTLVNLEFVDRHVAPLGHITMTPK